MVVAFCLAISAGVWAEDKEMPFTDIQENSWYNFYVQDLYNNNNGAGRNITYSLGALTSSNIRANCASIVYRSYKDGAGFNYMLRGVKEGIDFYYTPSRHVVKPISIFNDRVANGFSATKKF